MTGCVHTPAAPRHELVERVEGEVISHFTDEIGPTGRDIVAAMVLGSYPDTVIRVVATRGRQTRTCEWPLWDGSVTDIDTAADLGADEFLQALDVRIIEWLASPGWRTGAR